MSNLININIESQGRQKTLEVPDNMGLNLMELLKGNEYESIEGTCGGMALCATCHIRVDSSIPSLKELTEEEAAMLETLPLIFENSRLACQIKLNENLKELKIKLV